LLLIGPGIGTETATIDFISDFCIQASNRGLKCIFDADALNCISKLPEINLPLDSILTPHPKELARLLKKPVEEILNDRITNVIEAAQKFNCIVILKGARTLIAEPDGTLYINPTGNSALATAGTGDVLSGMIAGFVAQNLSLIDASILATFLHGLAGEIAAEELTEYSTTALNIIDYIPEAIKQLVS